MPALGKSKTLQKTPRKNGGEYSSRQKFIDGFHIQNVTKLEDSLSKKCPDFDKLPLHKEFRLLQTVVSIENKWFVVQQEVKYPKKLKKAPRNFFWKCEICMEKIHQFQSNYFILTSIYMEKLLILKAKMIIIVWRPFVPCSFFRFSFRATLNFPLMNALVYVDIDQGIHKGKMKVALNEKRKKLHGFSFSINIANFEAFL